MERFHKEYQEEEEEEPEEGDESEYQEDDDDDDDSAGIGDQEFEEDDEDETPKTVTESLVAIMKEAMEKKVQIDLDAWKKCQKLIKDSML